MIPGSRYANSSADACAVADMEKGNLSKWLKKEARRSVRRCHREIETDKATMEVEAPMRVRLAGSDPEAAKDVAVNTPIATILSDGRKVLPISARRRRRKRCRRA